MLLSTRQLEALVRERLGKAPRTFAWDRPAGELFSFRVRRTIAGFPTAHPVLDLGFALYFRPDCPELDSFADDETVLSVKDSVSGSYRLTAGADPGARHLYAAQVMRVIDGDTFLAFIDCGFGMIVRQRLRLRRVDAPELHERGGKEARAFVEARLRPRQVVVLRTFRTDKYDRYVCDVWYGKAGADAARVVREGVLLNEEMVGLGWG